MQTIKNKNKQNLDSLSRNGVGWGGQGSPGGAEKENVRKAQMKSGYGMCDVITSLSLPNASCSCTRALFFFFKKLALSNVRGHTLNHEF